MTTENISPWLRQIRRSRPITIISLEENTSTNIAIVGGGISGVATAYFLLRDTDKSVTLLERERIACGATGHNGGQVVAAFETPLSQNFQKNFSYNLISEGLKAINNAWNLLYSMIEETGIEVELQEVSSNLASLSIDNVLFMLEESQLREQLGLPGVDIFRGRRCNRRYAGKIQNSCLEEFPEMTLQEMLLTRDRSFNCALVGKSGLMNSALFCEGIGFENCWKMYPKAGLEFMKIHLSRKIEIRQRCTSSRTPHHEAESTASCAVHKWLHRSGDRG